MWRSNSTSSVRPYSSAPFQSEGSSAFQEGAEVLSEGGFFWCEGEVHKNIEGLSLYMIVPMSDRGYI